MLFATFSAALVDSVFTVDTQPDCVLIPLRAEIIPTARLFNNLIWMGMVRISVRVILWLGLVMC